MKRLQVNLQLHTMKKKKRNNLQLKISDQCSSFCYNLPKPSIVQEADNFFLDFEKICVLGHGNYGIVYKVRHKRISDIYALKIIRDIDCDSESQSTSPPSQETKILGFVDSPFVIKCHRIFEQLLPSSGGSKAILMEYMDGGTLDTRRSFSESSLAHIACQVLKGLEYLHACNIVHLDIKPSNLLVDRDLNVKIADFGVSKIMSYMHGSDNYCDSADVGTYAYMSPERLDRDSCRYDPKYVYVGDVWSLGVTLLELFVGHFPFFRPEKKSISWMDLVMVTCLGEPLTSWCIPEEASEELVSFIECCLEKDPSKRWTASQLLKHPYVLSSFAWTLRLFDRFVFSIRKKQKKN
ncbi:hypothetical protein LWI28_001057 [Acer negundo]|uniref:Protein kinase domain-containing protein n=1 Tax=Acer negundo TaxID=4023 RepID=A0AAD5NMJ9_ACENE|nr:hypothetical protein LWI28_001057 [Acer negundo]